MRCPGSRAVFIGVSILMIAAAAACMACPASAGWRSCGSTDTAASRSA